jgi:hypothetical protein
MPKWNRLIQFYQQYNCTNIGSASAPLPPALLQASPDTTFLSAATVNATNPTVAVVVVSKVLHRILQILVRFLIDHYLFACLSHQS